MAEYSPKYNKGITIYSNYSDNYLCHICPNEPEEPWKIHLLTQEHLSRYNYYIRYFQDINLSFVTCRICDEWIDKSSIYSHAINHKLIPWYRPDDELELLFKNFISKHDDYYYCHLCELEISSWYNALYHANDFNHKKHQIHELRDFFVDNLTFPSAIYDSMISNFIFPKSKEQLVCIICYENIDFIYTSILDHIDEDYHKNARIRFSESVTQSINNNNNHNTRNLMRNLQIKWNFHKKLEIIEEEMEEFNLKRVSSEKVYFTQCKICNCSIFGGEVSVMHHNKSKDHIRKKRQLLHKFNGKILEDPVFEESSNYYLADCSKAIDKNVIEIKEVFSISNYKREETFFWCILCNEKFTNQRYVLQHIKTRLHLKELKKKPLNNEFEYFNCKNCAREFHKFTEFSEEDHWKSLDHLENDVNSFKHENNNNEEKEDENKKESGEFEGKDGLPEGIEHIYDNIYLCTLCDRLFNDEESISSHIDTQNHMKNAPKVIFKLEESKFFCSICKNVAECLMTLRQHLKSTRHRDNLNEKIKELPDGIKKWKEHNFLCTICDKVVEKKEFIIEHINLDVHQEKLKQSNDNNVYCSVIKQETKIEQEVTEKISKSSDPLLPDFHDLSRGREVFFTKCITCDCDILGEHMSLSEHNHSTLHAKKTRKLLRKHSLMKRTVEPETRATKKRYFMVSPQPKIDETIVGLWEVAKGLYNGEKIFWCNICHSRVPGDIGVRQHLDGSRHRTNLQKVKDNSLPDEINGDVHDEKTNLKSNDKEYNESEISLIEDLFSSEKRKDDDLKVIEVAGDAEVSLDELKSEENCKNHEKIEEIDEKKEITSFLTELDAAIDKFSYATLQEEAEPLAPGPESIPSTSATIPEEEAVKNQEKTPIPPPIYHHRNHKLMSIECIICNVKVDGNYETSVRTEYRSHVSSKKHIDAMEKWINTPRVVKLERPDMKHFKWRNFFVKCCETCNLCAMKVEVTGYHQHLTKHFWKRFIDSSFSDEEGAPAESSESSKNQVNPEEFNAKAGSSDSPKQKSPNHLKTKLDIADAKAGTKDIYKIDEEQLQNIKISAILAFPIDKSIYCLVCQKNMDNCVRTFYEHLQSINHGENLKIMREDDELFREFPDQISDLSLACEYMEISESSVYCHACRIFLQNNPEVLRGHIGHERHIEGSSGLIEGGKIIYTAIRSMIERDYYSTQRYWCVLCNSIFHSESIFREHLKKKYHLNKLNYYAKKREKLIMDYCPICATLWFGFHQTYSYHSQQKMHKFHKNDGFFMINKLPHYAENLLINHEIQINEIEENEDDIVKILEDLVTTIGNEYPEAKVHVFGSRISGIGRKESDLDIFIDCKSQTESFYNGGNSTSERVQNRMKKVWMCLNRNIDIWSTPETVLNARIPIIKTKHKSSGIDCDLSFTNGLAVENTAVIRNYCIKYVDCRKLIMFIKNWLNHCELGGSKGINSYSCAWFVIYFLQIKKILPTVGELIKMSNVSKLIAGWETGVVDDYQIVTGDNFDKLLKEFFSFYANFDYRNFVICPLLGESLKKVDFQEIEKLPVIMNNYVKYIRSTNDLQSLRIDSPMCLQDPFELTHNVTKAVDKLTVNKFRIFCKLSADILDYT